MKLSPRILLLPVAGYLLLVSGCSNHSAPPPTGPVFLIVAIDETGSFIDDTDGWNRSLATHGRPSEPTKIHEWAQSLNLQVMPDDGAVIKAIKLLQAGDELEVIGIDDHTVDNRDIRLPVYQLDKSLPMIQLIPAQRTMVEKVSGITIRPESSGYTDPATGKTKGTPKGTDIVGTLEYCAELATREAREGYTTRILICSDFQDNLPLELNKFVPKATFPPGVALNAFYVVREEADGSITDKTKHLEEGWSKLMAKMNLQTVVERDFHDKSVSDKIDPIRQFMARN